MPGRGFIAIPGISRELDGALRGVKALTAILGSAGLKATSLIAIADTEMSLPEVRARYDGDKVFEYSEAARASAKEASEKTGLNVETFDIFNYEYDMDVYSSFEGEQKHNERLLRRGQQNDPKLCAQLTNLARERSKKNQQILGRLEHDNELVIRYAA